MGWIILLVVLGILLFVAELVLLPGITVAAIGAFCCLTAAVTIAFIQMGLLWGFVVLGITVLALVVCTVLFLRPKTWSKASLKTNISETIARPIHELIPLNTQVETLTRLAPMGKVIIDGETYEAKSLDAFVDPKTLVVVIGYDNNVLIVKTIK